MLYHTFIGGYRVGRIFVACGSCDALQLEATRRCASLSPSSLTETPVPKFEVAQLIRCCLIPFTADT